MRDPLPTESEDDFVLAGRIENHFSQVKRAAKAKRERNISSYRNRIKITLLSFAASRKMKNNKDNAPLATHDKQTRGHGKILHHLSQRQCQAGVIRREIAANS